MINRMKHATHQSGDVATAVTSLRKPIFLNLFIPTWCTRQANNNKGHKVSQTQPVKTGDYCNGSATDQSALYKHGDDDATSSSYQLTFVIKHSFSSINICTWQSLNIHVTAGLAAYVYDVKPFITLPIQYGRISWFASSEQVRPLRLS